MTKALLGLDIGTSSAKALIFDLNGAELSRAVSPPYGLNTPCIGWIEQDPEEVWQAVISVLQDAVKKADPDISVLALSIAAQSGSLLPADKDGNPIYPIITWMDGRTQELVQQWKSEGLQEQVRSISGWSLNPGLCLSTIAWLRQYDKETFKAARHYFSVNDFVVHRLTGQFCANPSNGGGMQLVDLQSGDWSDTLCEIAGITADQLSPIQSSGTVIGQIKPKICSDTGLHPQAVLVNGGHDQSCSALGLRINSLEELLIACGTAWVVTGVTASSHILHNHELFDANLHIVPKFFTISKSLGGLGASFEWWLNQTWRNDIKQVSNRDIYATLDGELAQTSTDLGPFFIPLTGGHENPATTRSGGFVGLHLSHTRADMTRAIMESAAFELRWVLDAARRIEFPVESLWMVGGAARSPHWPAIVANITGVPISVSQYDNWPALGAAIIAGVGIKSFENIEDGQAYFNKPAHIFSPDEVQVAFYNKAFNVYKEIA